MVNLFYLNIRKKSMLQQFRRIATRYDKLQQFHIRAQYDYEPSGRKCELDEAGLERFNQLVLGHPDITLEEIPESMQLSIKKSEISNILRNKLGFTFKKRWFMPANKSDQT